MPNVNKPNCILSISCFLAIAAAVLSLACQTAPESQSETSISRESEQNAVYSAVLSHHFAGKTDREFSIQKETSAYADDYPLLGDDYLERTSVEDRISFFKNDLELDSAKDDTLRDFDKEFVKSSNLGTGITFSGKYVFTEKAKIAEGKKSSDQVEIFPLIQFSNVGFNREGNQAIVRFNFHCPVLCGRGDFILLEKEKDIWIVKKVSNVWKS